MIASLGYVQITLLVIYLIFCLTFGHFPNHFSENFNVALDKPKAFDRSLLSKLPPYGFYQLFCTYIFSASFIVDNVLNLNL